MWIEQLVAESCAVLHDHLCNDMARHVGQSKVAALEAEGEAKVVETEQVQNGGMQVVDMDDVLDAVVADVVGLPERHPRLHAAAGQPHRERLDVMVAADHLPRL